jgi:hypothetical protein
MNPLLFENSISTLSKTSLVSQQFADTVLGWLTRTDFLGDGDGRPSHVTLATSAEWAVYFLRD